MGEKILTSGASEILNKLSGVVTQQIGLAWAVKDDLEKLKNTLQMILAVIADAESRQVMENTVRLWLRRLKEVAYDADDVMDDFSYEIMRRSERGDRFKHKVMDFVSSSNPLGFRFKMAKKIKDVNRRLDEITRDMGRFHLQITAHIETNMSYGESNEQRDRHTASVFSSDSEIVGREDDKMNIINLLTRVTPLSSVSLSDRNLEKVSVISLVGMGGLGKTTLAQLVYNDELVKKQFDHTIWVHVSAIFDVKNLSIKILESLGQTNISTMLNLDVLVHMVQDQLNGKKYLLVLDDLWSEDPEQWDRLKSVLFVGAQGSKILITTRQDQVASIVRGSTPPYNLEQLPDGACWSIMKHKAFSYGGAQNTSIMSDIGKKIAEKCCGLPLAAKFLGGLLHLKNKESDWISIRDDDHIWSITDSQKRILSILKLSYDNLPSHLKQCFSYCSIFPKNWEIKRRTLVQLWMAEGFIETSNIGNKRFIEDFGNECFESLVWSSFFQNIKKNKVGDIITCKMHDLVHDLAKDVLGDNELVFHKVSDIKDVSKFRRWQLKINEDISATFLKSLNNAKKLRTVFVPEVGIKVDPVIFSDSKYLRVLHVDFPSDVFFTKVPHLSLKLRHLRYLHLSCLDLRELGYGQSISELYNLETLVLTCMNAPQNLLTNIQSLKKLRHLEISWTDMEELPDSVTSLCNLQTLDLNHTDVKAVPDFVTGLKCLRYLDMSFNCIEKIPDFVSNLCNLETLDVSNCKKLKAIPEFVTLLVNLRIFCFVNCPLLEALPKEFGALTQLRFVDLSGTEIKMLPESFTNLNKLEDVDLHLAEPPKEVKNWTNLRKFCCQVGSAPVGIEKLVCLQELYYGVRECNDSIVELRNLNLLQELYLCRLNNVKDPMDAERVNLKEKRNLRALQLHWAYPEVVNMRWDQNSCNIQVSEALQPHTSLRELTFTNFIGSDLPKWMSSLPNLQQLNLAYCPGIKQLPASICQLPRLTVLFLSSMYLKNLSSMYFKSLNIGGFSSLFELYLNDMILLEELYYLPRLQLLKITGCKRLTKIPSYTSLQQLELNDVDHRLVNSVLVNQISLTLIYLECIQELEFLPVSIMRLRNLRKLRVANCFKFQGFRVNDIGDENEVALIRIEIYIDGLQELRLINCPVLKHLPDFGRCTSLRVLTIFFCPQVKESLTYDLKSLPSLRNLYVDFIQRDEQRGDTSDLDDLINLMN